MPRGVEEWMKNSISGGSLFAGRQTRRAVHVTLGRTPLESVMPTLRPGTISLGGTLRVLTLAALPLTLVACASTPKYDLQLAAAESAVSNANNTSTQSDASAELRVATDKLARAQEAARSRQPELALQLAQQAELDAQLAVLTARSVRAQRSAQESEEAARALRQEIERASAR